MTQNGGGDVGQSTAISMLQPEAGAAVDRKCRAWKHFVIYAMIIPYITLLGTLEPGSSLTRTRRLGASVSVNSNDKATTTLLFTDSNDQSIPRQLLVASSKQKWAYLWNSELLEGEIWYSWCARTATVNICSD